MDDLPTYPLIPPLPGRVKGGKQGRKLAHVERARQALAGWVE